MRRALPLAAALTATLIATPALATGLCDPDAHFCVQVDTTKAITCDLTRPGGLDPQTCTQEDATLRDQIRAAQWPIFRALVLRFDGWQAVVGVAKRPPTPELSNAEVDEHGKRVRAMAEARRKLDSFAPPRMWHVDDVQVIRLDSVWTEGDHRFEEIAMEVHASQGVYGVSVQGPARPELSALADAVIGTLDTVPAGRSRPSSGAMMWFVRACGFAGAALGYALVRLAFRRLGQRKRRGIDAQTLWPR
jgi:hypothetical protein